MEIDFLGVPNVPFWLFILLSLTTTATAMLGLITGTAGGLALLAVMANFFPPTLFFLPSSLFIFPLTLFFFLLACLVCLLSPGLAGGGWPVGRVGMVEK